MEGADFRDGVVSLDNGQTATDPAAGASTSIAPTEARLVRVTKKAATVEDLGLSQ